MNTISTRRKFMKSAAATGGLLGLGDLSFLARLQPVSAAEAQLDPKVVRLDSGIEPVVRLIEETPRPRLLEEIASRITAGSLSYRAVLAALLLAGVRNVQPRPVGFKFHAVLVVNSAHLASLSAPPADRWLPIFWALDYFKSSQQDDVKAGDWTMAPVDESAVPAAHRAREAFQSAMDRWDEAAADTAVAGLARSAGAHEIFEIFCRYGVRDFRDIGHKAIFVANSWRTLQCIGWQHAEPVLRSLAYALLEHGGRNPAEDNDRADLPWRRNIALQKSIRADWLAGAPDAAATAEMLSTLRRAPHEDDACDKVVELLNRGVAPQSIWDAFFQASGELLMRRPGIISLHAVTSANAIHYAFRTSGNDETRRMLLLQNAAFLHRFRGDLAGGIEIDRLEPVQPAGAGASEAIEDIFAEINRDRLEAAAKVLSFLDANPNSAKNLIDGARRYLFRKGTNSHDYKFSSAVLEDYFHVSPEARNRFLAASVFNLRGSGDKDNDLVRRTRAALGAA